MTSGRQKVPALNPNCALCLEHRQEQREKELHQGWRCKIKHYPGPANTSTHMAIITLGLFLARGIVLSSFLSFFKDKPEEMHKHWTRQGVACHGLWAKQC